jgi:hypothetical protein
LWGDRKTFNQQKYESYNMPQKYYRRTTRIFIIKNGIVSPWNTGSGGTRKKGAKLETFVKEKLNEYETKWKHEKNFNHLNADIDIPLPPAQGSSVGQ